MLQRIWIIENNTTFVKVTRSQFRKVNTNQTWYDNPIYKKEFSFGDMNTAFIFVKSSSKENDIIIEL